jgi:16S rRNA (guanine966-N2)-methyltransferase
MRGAIFSALTSLDVDLSRVLDIYAGSGALGIEALSRGAESCDFVERDRTACATIVENLRLTGFEMEGTVHCIPAERAATRLSGPFTLVLADPPYADTQAPAVLQQLASSSLVEQGLTIFAIEHGSNSEPAAAVGPLTLVNSRRHGDSAVSIYR